MQKFGRDVRIIFRAVEQRVSTYPLMSESGVRNSWLTLATNSSRVRSNCFKPSQIVEDDNGPLVLPIAVENRGGIDLEPSFGKSAEL